MKDIIIIAQFVEENFEKSNSRFKDIINMLIKERANVELITSNFSHENKGYKNLKLYGKNNNFKMTFLKEPAYKKNVCVKRLYSHIMLGNELEKYLRRRKLPDVVYCAVPSLSLAKSAAKYCKKNNVKFIIDVQDLWPEAFKLVFNVPIISNLMYYPMIKKADYIYSNADEIIAVSETYKNRALEVNKKCKEGLSVYLGTDLGYFDSLINKNKNNSINNANIKVVYIGTLGHSYNIKIIIDAIAILYKRGIKDIEFLIIGDGPLKSEFEMYSKKKKVKCIFTGRLEYSRMVKKLVECDIAVNPITSGAAQSIINKVGDYAAAGLPVINTQECKEYRNLVEKYDVGINCNEDNIESIVDAIYTMYNDKKLRILQGKNNRYLAEILFDRKKTYYNIVKSILK